MFPSPLLRNLQQSFQSPHPRQPLQHELPPSPFDVHTNPWKAKRPWPPDFATLTTAKQLKLEKKYKRRAAAAYKRPAWDKSVKLAMWGCIVAVGVYSVFFMEAPEPQKGPSKGSMGPRPDPFKAIRDSFKSTFGELFEDKHIPRPQRPQRPAEITQSDTR